jgi:hypothetical protein
MKTILRTGLMAAVAMVICGSVPVRAQDAMMRHHMMHRAMRHEMHRDMRRHMMHRMMRHRMHREMRHGM